MPEPWVEPYHRRVMQIIENHGHAVQFVGAGETESQFAYSVGLTLQRRPEIMIVGGFPPEMMQSLINSAAKSNEAFADRFVSHTVIAKHRVVFREVTAAVVPEKARVAVNLFQRVRVLQMFLSDPKGLFPWQPGCERYYGTQACLDYISEVPTTQQ